MSNKVMLYSLKAGALCARLIPRRIGIKIASALGYCFGLFPTRMHKRIFLIHKRISPTQSSSALRKRTASVIASYCAYWWDVFWLSSPRTLVEINELVNLEGCAYWDEAKKQSQESGVGIILALPHMGSWEIAGAWLAVHGYPPVVIAERLNPPELFELFTNTRTNAGMTVVAHDDHPTSKLLTALNAGTTICLVADRDISRKGISVPFFGSNKTMPTGPAALAFKTGAVILPVCMYVGHDTHVNVTFYPPLFMEADRQPSERTDTIEKTTRELAAIFENMISRDPSQWHVLHDEWEK